MNLDASPSVDQLQALWRTANDSDSDHVLWVDNSARVHLSALPEDQNPVLFETNTPEMKLRYETFCCGNDYVGVTASKDEKRMEEILSSLQSRWKNRSPSGVEYIELF